MVELQLVVLAMSKSLNVLLLNELNESLHCRHLDYRLLIGVPNEMSGYH